MSWRRSGKTFDPRYRLSLRGHRWVFQRFFLSWKFFWYRNVRDEVLPSYIGIIASHYKDPYEFWRRWKTNVLDTASFQDSFRKIRDLQNSPLRRMVCFGDPKFFLEFWCLLKFWSSKHFHPKNVWSRFDFTYFDVGAFFSTGWQFFVYHLGSCFLWFWWLLWLAFFCVAQGNVENWSVIKILVLVV